MSLRMEGLTTTGASEGRGDFGRALAAADESVHCDGRRYLAYRAPAKSRRTRCASGDVHTCAPVDEKENNKNDISLLRVAVKQGLW